MTLNSIYPQSQRDNYANANIMVTGMRQRNNTRGRPIKTSTVDLGDKMT